MGSVVRTMQWVQVDSGVRELRFHKLCATARKEKILSGVLSVSQKRK